jgi:hypothetical protein
MVDKAWASQAASLVEVQKYGSNLERTVRDLLDWDGGRVLYDAQRNYRAQIDCVYPSLDKPAAIVSVTYSDPDTPGHSNENKLQLKLGELALLKNAYPDLRAVLVLGGTREAWLQYVIKAFQFFYDDVIFLWEAADFERLLKVAADPIIVSLKHQAFWTDLRAGWKQRKLSPAGTKAPMGLVRYAILDELIASAGASEPAKINNEIARHCMQASVAARATEWNHFVAQRWQAIEMSRSYFNPVEAATDLSLRHGRFIYEGGLAKDVDIPSLLHQLGMRRTKLSEDFVLYSEKLDQPVYIQCKASGGGRRQHGKNIQNRTKEQVARGILYTAQIYNEDQLKWKDKHFHWISILDGNWGVTQREPLKYVHMLQTAGYDKLFCASDLLNPDLSLKRKDNPLIDYLRSSLACRPM